MITERQKQSIEGFIKRMTPGKKEWMSDFTPEERLYIIHCMETQTGKYNFIIESNGTKDDYNTITRFWTRIARF